MGAIPKEAVVDIQPDTLEVKKASNIQIGIPQHLKTEVSPRGHHNSICALPPSNQHWSSEGCSTGWSPAVWVTRPRPTSLANHLVRPSTSSSHRMQHRQKEKRWSQQQDICKGTMWSNIPSLIIFYSALPPSSPSIYKLDFRDSLPLLASAGWLGSWATPLRGPAAKLLQS